MFSSNCSGGDWAHAAEVFRKYDADGSGRLDREELLAALRECELLTNVSAKTAGKALADMDSNGDGQVSFEEFREAYSRLSKIKAAEQRQTRLHSRKAAAQAIPPNAAVDPRLKAAFFHFASFGGARGLSERTPRGGGQEGMSGRQFQRACAAAGVPLESGVLDVIFATLCAGRGRTLSFQRFLEALAQAAQEGGVPLDEVLDAMRLAGASRPASPPGDGSAHAGYSPRPKSSPRPRSAGPGSARGLQACVPPMAGTPAPAACGGAGGATPGSAAACPLNKLQQRVCMLQQLLDEGLEKEEEEEEDGGSIPAHPGGGASVGQEAEGAAPGAAVAQLLGQLNPAYQQAQEGTTHHRPAADLAAFRLDVLSLLDQRCEAAERRCAALVATRARMAQEMVGQVAAALGGAQQGGGGPSAEEARLAVAAVRTFESQVAALDGRLGAAVRQVGLECRGAVAALEARLDGLQRAQEAALQNTNQAILAIAKRVSALSAGQAQGQGERKRPAAA